MPRRRFLIIHNLLAGTSRRGLFLAVLRELERRGCIVTTQIAEDVETDRTLAEEGAASGDYDAIVAAARNPVLYAEWGVPDTPLGRYESVGLHMILFLHRTRGAESPLDEFAQDVLDEFFKDVDHSIRELGVGDPSVPKRMKKLARMFYGRAAAYGDALDAGDVEALAAAMQRNIRPDVENWQGARPLADYAVEAAGALDAQPVEKLIAAEISFPDAQREI